jgi:CBS domain-containing protein
MHRSNLLVPDVVPQIAPAPRHRTKSRRLRAGDPAVRAMTDFWRDPPLTTSGDCDLDTAMDDMFRLGVRAFLVVRDFTVVGLVTAEDIREARRSTATRVLEVMTAAEEMPAIDWQVLREATIRDLLEIFEGAKVEHLVVLENESAQRASVRGLVHRSRIEQHLRVSTEPL